MFDLNFSLFHDENICEFLSAEKQQSLSTTRPNQSKPKQIYQQLNTKPGQPGLLDWHECAQARHQGGHRL